MCGWPAGRGVGAPAITMAHQDHRPAHGVDGRPRVHDVVGVGGLGRLSDRYLVSIIDEDARDGFPTETVGERSMHQDHVLNMLFHDYSPFSLKYPLGPFDFRCRTPSHQTAPTCAQNVLLT